MDFTSPGGYNWRMECCDNGGKEKILINLKKAESSIRKVAEMVEEGRYCIDTMQQNLAVMGMLRSVHQMLMESHLNTCFDSAIVSGSDKKKKEMMEEIVKVTKMSAKDTGCPYGN